MPGVMNPTLQVPTSAHIRVPEAMMLQVSAMRLPKIHDREPSRVARHGAQLVVGRDSLSKAWLTQTAGPITADDSYPSLPSEASDTGFSCDARHRTDRHATSSASSDG
jgi:hypothetical protein